MNTILWILQAVAAATFIYSGINKSIFSIRKLVYEKGQTGVENLSITQVRFIGLSEILGAIGLILPWWLNILPGLTPVSAILLSFIMIPASFIHHKRKEPKNVVTNVILFGICIFIAYGRIYLT
ncbi:MAG TPA: DoxX family protein [Puia sp.]|nr:DoxX family protein [Puia sp.]